MSRMAIDPGLSGTGITLWSSRSWQKQVNPLWCRNLYSSGGGEWVARMENICKKVSLLVDEFHPTHIYCEMPEFFDDSSGHMAAKKGDLGKLTMLVGAYAQIAWRSGAEFMPITPSEWKGQTSKDMVIRKIKEILPTIYAVDPKSHSWDSIGIGLFAQGIYNRRFFKS